MAKKTKQEQKRKMSTREMKQFTSSKLDTARMLIESGKKQEAIVYLFQILTWLIQDKHDIKKGVATTLKEYFTKLILDSLIPPENVHPFVNLLEEVLYSHHDMTFDVLNVYKQKWASLYKDISGDVAPGF
nr:hypothetical protein [Candidatus Sigynarchaeota archaeon]